MADEKHLTVDEQNLFHDALRKSVKVVTPAPAPAATGERLEEIRATWAALLAEDKARDAIRDLLALVDKQSLMLTDAQFKARMARATALEDAARLKRIAAIIGHVDNRCMAAEGNVTPTLSEMRQEEISAIYALAMGKPEDWRP